MTEGIVQSLIFVDDSDDEVHLSKLLLQMQNVDIDLVHYSKFETLYDDLKTKPSKEIAKAIIVLDLNLTIMKGTEAVEILKSDDRYTETIIGICTGSEDPADRKNAEEAGADFFVGKPLDVKSLSAICDAVETINLVERDNRVQLVR